MAERPKKSQQRSIEICWFAALYGIGIPLIWLLLAPTELRTAPELQVLPVQIFFGTHLIVGTLGIVGLAYLHEKKQSLKKSSRKEDTQMPEKNEQNQNVPATPARLRGMILILAISVLMLVASVGVVAVTGETSWCGGIVFGAFFTMISGRQAYRMSKELQRKRS